MDPEEREDEEQRRLEFELAKPKEGNFLKRRFFRLLQRNPESGKSNLNAFISLLVLFLVYVLNQADRLVLAVVLPDGMRCDSNKTQDCNVVNQTTSNSSSSSSACSPGDCIDVSETGQGLLTGPAFTVVYVLAGIPLAWFSDKKSRLAVLVIGITFWSLMVLLTGFVKNFWELLLARIGLGLGEVMQLLYIFLILFSLDFRRLAIRLPILSYLICFFLRTEPQRCQHILLEFILVRYCELLGNE